MVSSQHRQRTVISVGGSMIVPNGGLSEKFLIEMNDFIRKQLALDPSRQFFLVVGGGATARHYRDAGRDVVGHELINDDLDWLGIHATRLNAHLIRTIFQDIAHSHILTEYNVIKKVEEPVVIAAGWKPGWSTDYCAALLCEDYQIDTMINISNVSQIFDKDPNKYPDAKPKQKMSWTDFRHMVGDTWIPGMNSPFDPIAAKKSQELGVRVVFLSGDNFDNLTNYFNGEPFIGTVLE